MVGVRASGDPVVLDIRNHVATISLNRPHVLNALDTHTHRALRSVWDRVEHDPNVRVVVLTGSGDRAFCVGQDLKETAAQGADGTQAVSFGSVGKAGAPRFTDRFDITKPVIARVFGHVLGGGFELAMAADLIVASEDTSFGLPEVLRGLIPGAGGVFRLGRQIPQRIALQHLLTGEPISAARALELGLVNAVVPRNGLDAAVDEVVTAVLRAAPLSVRAIKEAFYGSAALSLEEAFRQRFPLEARRRNSADAIEGVRAFVEKRQPTWVGE